MAEPGKPASPRTPDGDVDWESIFDNPETGLIPRIQRSKTPARLRQNTDAVFTKLFARVSAPDYVTSFVEELNDLLPDDLDTDQMADVSDAIAKVMRQIKNERIAQIRDAKETAELGRKTGRKKDGRGNSKAQIKGQKQSGSMSRSKRLVLASVGMLVLLGGGIGGWWWIIDPAWDAPSTRTEQLIAEMRAAARGEGPERHVFGWALHTRVKAGLVGVTAIGVPTDACASAAWVFVNRGNVVINDMMPEKISPQILRQFCALKGQRAKLTWLQRIEDVEKNQ